MFCWPTHLRETAQWLLTLAQTPGWQEHAKARRDELLAHRLYGQELRAELDALQRKDMPDAPRRSR